MTFRTLNVVKKTPKRLTVMRTFSYCAHFATLFITVSGFCGEYNLTDDGEAELIVTYNNDSARQVANFLCPTSFFNAGVQSLNCSSNNTWILNGNKPKCDTKSCPTIIPPTDGTMSCTNYMKVMSQCSFTCNEGYQTVGATNITCSSSTLQWSKQTPTCQAMSCPAIRVPSDGSMSCTNSMGVMSQCSFNCNEGYKINGATNISCNSSSLQWSEKIPNCQISECPELPTPSNGEKTCTAGKEPGSYCNITCKPGFEISSLGLLHCDSVTLLWNATHPTCKVRKCISLESPRNGLKTCATLSNHIETCTFSCNLGFLLTADAEFSCDPVTLTWSGNVTAGTCDEKKCPAVPDVENGVLTCTDRTKVNSVCTLTCKKGHQVDGPPTITCDPDTFEWPKRFAQCQVAHCDTPGELRNGKVECTDAFRLRSVCVADCLPGFEQTGVNSIRCLGPHWSQDLPTCTERKDKCPPLSEIANGKYTCNKGLSESSRCLFSCNIPYHLHGASQIECGSDLQWDFVQPECKNMPNFCSPPMEDMFGELADCDGENLLGADCKVSCPDGEANVFKCLIGEDQRPGWRQTKENCVLSTACDKTIMDVLMLINESPSPEEHGNIVRFFIQTLNMLHQSILASFTWMRVGQVNFMETCLTEFLTQPVPSNFVAFSRLVKEIVTIPDCSTSNFLASSYSYVTKYGRGLSKPVLVFFQTGPAHPDIIEEAGKLVNLGMKLVVIGLERSNSEDFSSLGKGIIFLGPVSYGELDQIVPFVDLHIKGNHCPGSGCRLASTNVERGEVSCSYVHGTGIMCEFSCHQGSFISGESVITCQELANQYSAWDSEIPTCESAFPCPSILSSLEMWISCTNSFDISSECGFGCNDGFFLIGPASVVCIDSKPTPRWNDRIPTCESELLCQPPLMTPMNGSLSCQNGNHFNSECRFMCDEGYNIQGPATVRCDTPLQEGGAMWNNSPPKCIGCRDPPCDRDLLVAVDISAAASYESFRRQIEWLQALLAGYEGSIEDGSTHLGIIRVKSSSSLTCDDGKIAYTVDIVLRLESYEPEYVHQVLDEMPHDGRCRATYQTMSRALRYLAVVGRGAKAARQDIVLLSNNPERTEVEKAKKLVEDEGVTVVASVVSRENTNNLVPMSRMSRSVHEDVALDGSFLKHKSFFRKAFRIITGRNAGDAIQLHRSALWGVAVALWANTFR